MRADTAARRPDDAAAAAAPEVDVTIGIIGAGNIGVSSPVGSPRSGTTSRSPTPAGRRPWPTCPRGPVRPRSPSRGTPGRIALPIAGDDPAATATVSRLVDERGFDPVDAGRIEESWRFQPDTPACGAELDADGLRRALAAASPGRPPDRA